MNIDKIRDIISGEWDLNASDLRILNYNKRLYSTIATAILRTQSGVRRFIIKETNSNPEHAVRLASRAREIFKHDADVFLPRLVFDRASGLIISEMFAGASLQDYCRVSYRQNPLKWRSNLETAVARTGKWLATYHATSRRMDNCESYSYYDYLSPRRKLLEYLPGDLGRQLESWAKTHIIRTRAIIHGDYSPHNVLIDRRRICVIDFGIEEWTEMSPVWDLATMTTSLEKNLRFSWRSPFRWSQKRIKKIIEVFLKSYGCDIDRNSYGLGCALCHLVAFGEERQGSPTAIWHLRELTRGLSGYDNFI